MKMNTDSGNRHKVFTLRQNRCSHKTRTGVHFEPEWVFTLGQNMQQGMPTSIFLDRTGQIRFSHAGFFTAKTQDYEHEIQQLLQEDTK